MTARTRHIQSTENNKNMYTNLTVTLATV